MMVGITGHQRIPSPIVSYVEHELRDTLSLFGVTSLTIVTSLAAGADQLCATVSGEYGATLHVIVPCAEYEQTFELGGELERYRALLKRAGRVEYLNFPEPSEAAFLAAGQRVVDLSDVLIAIWDGEPARGAGGTGDIVAYAKHKGVAINVLWPHGYSR